MTVVLDTVILIDHLRGRSEARDLLVHKARKGHRLVASVVTRTEIIAGMRVGEEVRTHQLLDAVEWMPVDEQLADLAGELARRFVRSHRGIGASDYLVAATATWLDAEQMTLNLKHFPMFPGLAAPY
ncbi:type II toxin-antitoxin system VapC family toxin [Nocardioides immobilis]|uniref:Ribonuclease VapC n=1 Tax=Nocardioides immobilis TaxID=2049295 RepID=A0A417Y6C9_9ACTN|nr:type II toxin-antitoxin system VapC family toxin [Nocardioides immobilis]RHW28258.1 type II toxin-antitoxin system VapC family toxin [Nocardioides immobilis]